MTAFDIIRIALAIQAHAASDPVPMEALTAQSPEIASLVVVEPSQPQLWEMQGEVVADSLSLWLNETEVSDAFLIIVRLPRIVDRDIPQQIERLLAMPSGIGPEFNAFGLCLQTPSGLQAYWLNQHWNDRGKHLSLWRSSEDDVKCQRSTPEYETAREGLIAANDAMIAYTAKVFGPQSGWITEHMIPYADLIRSNGEMAHRFDGLLQPGDRKALLEAAFGLDIFGGMGSWNDHFPPEELENEFHDVEDSRRAAWDRAILAGVNGIDAGSD